MFFFLLTADRHIKDDPISRAKAWRGGSPLILNLNFVYQMAVDLPTVLGGLNMADGAAAAKIAAFKERVVCISVPLYPSSACWKIDDMFFQSVLILLARVWPPDYH